MEKGKFSQNTTRFKDKSKNIQPVIIDTELVNSLIGDETNKAPSVKAVNEALADKVTKPAGGLAKVQWVFGQDKNGKPNALAAEQGNQEWHLARYLRTDDTAANSDKKGTLVVTMPQKPLHAANKHYVDDGLAGKVDCVENALPLALYGTGDLDEATGRRKTRLFTRNANGTGNMFIASFASVSDAATFDRTDDNFVKALKYTLGVPDPIYPIQVANKRYVDAGLTGKLDSKAQSLTGIWFYAIRENKDVAMRGVTSPSAWNVPLYATNGVLYTNDPTLATSSEKEKACANVGYVDGKISELEHGLYNALGAQYIFEHIPFSGPMASISENVLPFVYVEKIGEATGYSTATGEHEGPVQITYIEFRDAMGVAIGSIRKSDEGQFVKIPEGTKSIYVQTDLSGDSIRVDVLLKVQVKVGA